MAGPDTENQEGKTPVRAALASFMGSAVEYYDFFIFGSAAALIFPHVFFPSSGDAALVMSFATFAFAYVARPVGAVFVGHFGDRIGRRKVLLFTLLLMGGGTFLIGCLPTFEQVGWLAPVGLLLARVVQGLSLGGEVSNASAYLGEIAPDERRGRYSAFFYISTGSAVLLASVLGFVLARALSEDAMQSWGWRLPFILGGVLGLIGLWLRRSLAETELFEAHKTERVPHPLRTTLREHPKAVGQLVGFTMLSTLCYYTFFSALTPFAVNTREADAVDVFLALSIATAVFVGLQYPMGAIADRFGRKPQLLVWSAAMAVLIVPLSTLVKPGLVNLVVVFTVGLGLYTAMTSIAPAIMSELFPTALRGLGIGAWYNLTVALFGGTAPLVIQTLSAAGYAQAFFWYVASGAVIAFLVILTLPETRGQVLK